VRAGTDENGILENRLSCTFVSDKLQSLVPMRGLVIGDATPNQNAFDYRRGSD